MIFGVMVVVGCVCVCVCVCVCRLMIQIYFWNYTLELMILGDVAWHQYLVFVTLIMPLNAWTHADEYWALV